MRLFIPLVFAFLPLSTPALSQMTEPAQARPILDMTKANWIGVRRWEGKDLLYFTHLETWRCALASIYFSVNDTAAEPYGLIPCKEGQGSPAPISATDHTPFVSFPLDSISTVTIEVIYKDGVTSVANYQRNAIELP